MLGKPTLRRLPSLADRASRARNGLIRGIAGAPASTRAGRLLDRALRVPWQSVVAFGLFSYLLVDAGRAGAARGYPEAWLGLIAIPAGLAAIRRPLLLGLVMAAAGVWLRALYLGYPETCDQMAVSRAALGIVGGGVNPYGYGYPESVPAGAPFPYGPLATITSIAGVPGEVVAFGGILLILAFCRALVTLAWLAAWVSWIELGVCGINDQVPALLLLGGLLLFERRRSVSGGVLVALSAGIKPYSLAWFPGLIGWAGVASSIALLVTAAIAWLPLLAWGPRSYLDSIELARSVHARSENTLNLPEWRFVALPLAALAFLARSWEMAVLSGAAIFCVVLFLDFWASFGYWFVVLPPLGIIAERALRRFVGDLRQARIASRPLTSRPHHPDAIGLVQEP